jgi:hypothetical protein
MLDREKENQSLNLGPVKYHGKWPFKRIYGMQVCRLETIHFMLSFGVCFVSTEPRQCCSNFATL